ncbi:MAG: CerR family C-terminal domain-containing protein [Desulfobacterales bacterium]|nr:CerR family C-terminal domain-containing protein [Desulfobacterales bacterium]
MSEIAQTTKERIIEVAGEIFGKEGFKAATIRKIAQAANANVAAINYYFRDKEGLYSAVLEDVFSKGFEKFPSNFGFKDGMSSEEKLKAFIQSMFYRLLSHEGWAGIHGKGKLIAKEILNPTPAFEGIVEKYIKPHKEVLASIISDMLGDKASIDKVLPCIISVIGQCLYYAYATQIIQRIAQEYMPGEENLNFLAEHVWKFSLGGIEKIKSS